MERVGWVPHIFVLWQILMKVDVYSMSVVFVLVVGLIELNT